MVTLQYISMICFYLLVSNKDNSVLSVLATVILLASMFFSIIQYISIKNRIKYLEEKLNSKGE